MKAGRKPKEDSRFTSNAARLAQIVREARGKAGLSQQQLADEAQVSLSWISKLEQGKIVEPGLFPVLTVLRVLRVGGDVLESTEGQ